MTAARLPLPLTDRRLRRGAFTSVLDLVDAIEIWTGRWNDDARPFVWHKVAEEIIEKVRREMTTSTSSRRSRPVAVAGSR